LGIFVIQTAIGQSEFQPGYIVSLKGDTLKGFVKYKIWNENLNKISFANQLDGPALLYTPTDIKEFGVKSEIYKSAIVEEETSPDNMSSLDHSSELNISIDTTFLQSLVLGPKSLYYYKNRAGKYQFYIGQDTGFKLLYYKRYFRDQEFNGASHMAVTENKTYVGQLTVYLQDCPEIASMIGKLKYNMKSMQGLFDFYYQKMTSNAVFRHQEEVDSREFGFIAGITMTSPTFKGKGFELLENMDFGSSVNPSVGLFYNIVLPRNFKKWSICNEIIFNSFSTSGSYYEFDNPEKYKTTTASLGFSYIKMNNLLRFDFLAIGKMNLFLDGGISNGIIISEINEKLEESRFYSTDSSISGKVLEDIRKHELGFTIGFGAKMKNYSFEMRGEKGNGMSIYNNLSSKIGRYSLLFGYRF
jgi:hypothetical protein